MTGTTIALLLIAVVLAGIAYFLWARNAQDSVDANAPDVIEYPYYEYPVSYSSDYYWYPWLSYGSIYDYRRFHGYSRNPPRYRQAAFDGAARMGPYVTPRSSPPPMPRIPSMVPRAGMSHPMSGGSRGGGGWGGGGGRGGGRR